MDIWRILRDSKTSAADRGGQTEAIGGYPLLGALPDLVRDPLGFTTRIAHEHGSPACLDLGLSKLFLISHPDHIQHVLRDNNHNYGKVGGIWDVFRMALGNGLGSSEGAFWMRQRRMMQPHFSRQRIAELAESMVDAISDGLVHFDAAVSSDGTVDVCPQMELISMRVIIKTMFGGRVQTRDVEVASDAMQVIQHFINSYTWTYFLPQWLPLPGRKRYREAMRTIDSLLFGVIDELRRSGERSDSLISTLQRARDEETGERMSDEQLRDEAFTIFVAGYETTATAVSWACYLLTQNPAAQRAIQEEVDRVLGRAAPTFRDFEKLRYTKMTLQEALRIHPPIWIVPRTSKAEDRIGSYRIPAKSTLGVLTYATHRNPAVWPEPDRFDPERFSPEATADRSSFAYLPFGAGPRICIGSHFALMEGVLLLAMLSQRYSMKLARDRRVEPHAVTILERPRGKLDLILTRR